MFLFVNKKWKGKLHILNLGLLIINGCTVQLMKSFQGLNEIHFKRLKRMNNNAKRKMNCMFHYLYMWEVMDSKCHESDKN